MKIDYILIENVGLIDHEKIQLDKPLILFFGAVRQGKTTILNSFRWLFGATWPSDIIKHGEKEAKIEVGYSGEHVGTISRSWYRSKKGDTMARETVWLRDGVPVKKPMTEIEKFINPFLLNQNHLLNMGETERKKFFTDLFAVDTSVLDAEAYQASEKAKTLRAQLTTYGEIDLTPVETVDAGALKTELATIRADWQKTKTAIEQEMETARRNHARHNSEINDANAEARTHNSKIEIAQNDIRENNDQIARLQAQIDTIRQENTALETWLKSNPKREMKPGLGELDLQRHYDRLKNEEPDTTELEARIQDAAAQNVRAAQFQANKATAARRDAQRQTLEALEARQAQIKAEKTAKLAAVTDESGIAGLKFDVDGNFTYKGTTASMLSTSEIMELSSQLSACYPPGFSIEMIDRGESLGESIYDFIKRAQDEDKTILATIVGEKPAKVPANVGVFVVKDGKLL
jgi:DNA repair exonuclease SbcCD ATPase subunit